jgi:hypothetical protein
MEMEGLRFVIPQILTRLVLLQPRIILTIFFSNLKTLVPYEQFSHNNRPEFIIV